MTTHFKKGSANLADIFSEKTHTHDSRYYTESEINTKLAGKAAANHTHTLGARISFMGNLKAKWRTGSYGAGYYDYGQSYSNATYGAYSNYSAHNNYTNYSDYSAYGNHGDSGCKG